MITVMHWVSNVQRFRVVFRLDGLLDLAVRASSMAADPFREDISCGLHSFRVEVCGWLDIALNHILNQPLNV